MGAREQGWGGGGAPSEDGVPSPPRDANRHAHRLLVTQRTNFSEWARKNVSREVVTYEHARISAVRFILANTHTRQACSRRPGPVCGMRDSRIFFTLVTRPRRSLSLQLSDTKVYEPQIRARLGNHNTTILGYPCGIATAGFPQKAFHGCQKGQAATLPCKVVCAPWDTHVFPRVVPRTSSSKFYHATHRATKGLFVGF